MSLRATISWLASILLVLALGGAVGMVRLTGLQHQAAGDLMRAYEKVRLAGDLRIALLRSDEASTPEQREAVARRIDVGLRELSDFVSTPEGRALEARARVAVDDFLKAQGTPVGGVGGTGSTRLVEALSALEGLVSRGEVQADRALAETARWDRVGDMSGWGLAVVLVLGVAAVLAWVWLFAFKPLFLTARAMERFGAGHADASAPLRGPSEVQAISRQFNAMVSALSEAHVRQLAFVAGIAHDLRSPIGAVRLAAAALQRAKQPLPPEEVGRRVALIDRQAAQVDRLVCDFLDRARIEAGAFELKRAVVDLRDVVRVAVEPFEGASPAHGVSLRLPAAPALAECDRGRIEQILTNLLSNAIKYSPDGGGIEVSVERDGETLRTTVRDHGLGIAKEDLASLFQPYQRVGAHRQQIAGVGLGLFVSRRIAEAHGGELRVESVPSEGSTFRLILPAASQFYPASG